MSDKEQAMRRHIVEEAIKHLQNRGYSFDTKRIDEMTLLSHDVNLLGLTVGGQVKTLIELFEKNFKSNAELAETIDPRRIGIMDWDIYHETVKKLSLEDIVVSPEMERTMIDVILPLDKTKDREELVLQVYSIVKKQWQAKHDLDFAMAVSDTVVRMGGDPLNNDDVIGLLKYRDEFENGENVWDGTRDEHYAKWILNVWRAPAPDTYEDGGVKFRYKTLEGEVDAVPSTEFGKYLKSFVAFSGADAILVINGRAVGEASEITWTKYLKGNLPDGRAVHGKLRLVVFDREPIRKLLERKRTTMCIVYANEYGQRAYQPIRNPEFWKMEGGISIDNIVQEVIYHYRADDVEMLPFDGPITQDNGDLNPLFDQ